ncbi:hypothetical protein Tco_1270584 [Tanacetum coccineum]
MESYYSRFYKMMNEMIRNNLTVATIQVNVQFLQQLQPEWTRFVTIVKQQHDLDTNANPLALVAAAYQYPDPYYQAPKPHRSLEPPSKQSSSTRYNATTKYKGKEISKPITPQSESAFEEDNDPEQAQRDKDINKNVDTSPSQVVQQTRIQCFNYKEIGHFAKEYWKPKRVKDYTYHKEKMLLCKQDEKVVPLQAKQANWLADTNEEIDEQELEAHYSYMAKIKEVPTADSGTDSEPLEQVITDLKLKEEKDNDKMISMEKQLTFLNEIVYKRNQSIQTILMLAPKGPTFNGRPNFGNPMYLKKAQSEKAIFVCDPV